MIRFNCPGCKKVLNAPDEKAGVRLPCPGCKQVVQVPAASMAAVAAAPNITAAPPSPPPSAPAPEVAVTPTSGTPSSELPKSFGQRFVAESGAVALATFLQTVRPISYVFSLQKRNKLRRKAADAQFTLGQRMYELKIGDKKLASKIQELGERVHNIEAVRGDAREAAAERKGLIAQMAEPAMSRDKVPESIEGEHERARTAKIKLQDQEHSLAGALGGLLPPDRLGWRRIIIGYGLAFSFLAFCGFLYFQSSQSSAVVKARENERQARQDKEKQQLQDDDREKKTEEIVSLCGPSVALIRWKEGTRSGGGTGFMIRPGILATNAHVVDRVLASQLKIYYPSAPDQGKTPHSARVLYFDAKRDLAMLAVEPKVPPLRLARDFTFKSGMGITIIGCPGVGEKQLENAVNTGNLSTRSEVGKMPFYQLGISANPGNSGGPVFDNRGQVIGVVTLKAEQENISYCIPWQDIKDRIEAIEKEDPAKTAAVAQANHGMHVVVIRAVGVCFLYGRYMNEIAAHMQGRPQQDGFNLAKAGIEVRYRGMDRQIMTPEIRAIGSKLTNDPNLPADVRQKFGVAWGLCEEMRSYCESPRGNSGVYITKSREFHNKMINEVLPWIVTLGFDPDGEDQSDK